MRTSALDGRREHSLHDRGIAFAHTHDLVGDMIGLLFVGISGLIDSEFGLEEGHGPAAKECSGLPGGSFGFGLGGGWVVHGKMVFSFFGHSPEDGFARGGTSRGGGIIYGAGLLFGLSSKPL